MRSKFSYLNSARGLSEVIGSHQDDHLIAVGKGGRGSQSRTYDCNPEMIMVPG